MEKKPYRFVGYRNDRFFSIIVFFIQILADFECYAILPMLIFRAWATCGQISSSVLCMPKAGREKEKDSSELGGKEG